MIRDLNLVRERVGVNLGTPFQTEGCSEAGMSLSRGPAKPVNLERSEQGQHGGAEVREKAGPGPPGPCFSL